MDDRWGKPASRRAADRHELFEHLVESSTDFAIVSMDPKGAVTSWNTGAD